MKSIVYECFLKAVAQTVFGSYLGCRFRLYCLLSDPDLESMTLILEEDLDNYEAKPAYQK